ncbi:MAG: ABC transporter permease [Aggregatilineales bacterium]
MNKIWAITYKELYSTFTNTTLLGIMIVAPLLIATIIALAFGGSTGPAGNISNLPIAIVNLDSGDSGSTLVNILSGENSDSTDDSQQTCSLDLTTPQTDGDAQQTDTTLAELFDATVLDDVATARTGVENGDYVAAVIIPADFSTALAPQIVLTGNNTQAQTGSAPQVEVYANNGNQISASIVNSVVQGITNSLITGNIAISATINTTIAQNPMAALQIQDNEAVNAIFGCAFTGNIAGITLTSQQVQASQSLPLTAQLLVAFGAAQAVFFALFTGQFGIISIIEERREGTLQRLLVSPTPRAYILGGKLIGTFFTSMFQIIVLLLALMLIASLIGGEFLAIWGTNIIAIVALTFALALCVAGLGVLLSGIVRTPEQMGSVGAIVNIVLGVAGGVFFSPLPSPIREMSFIYWGVDAFTKLSENNPDILINLFALLVQGTLFFVIGLFLFNRRVEI